MLTILSVRVLKICMKPKNCTVSCLIFLISFFSVHRYSELTGVSKLETQRFVNHSPCPHSNGDKGI